MASAAQQMADLGLLRRDIVSAQEADARGRPLRSDPREEERIRAEVQARRQRYTGGDEGGGQAAILSLWNNPETFERDEVTGQLENRMDGQGHRANLRRQLEHTRDDRWESTEARVGEERARYLQERGASNLNYVPSGPSGNLRQRIGSGGLNGGPAATTPRSFLNGNRINNRNPLVTAPRDPNRARALSPSRHGRTRFGPDGQRTVNGARVATAASAGLDAAARLRARAGNTPQRQVEPNTAHSTQAGPAPTAPPTAAGSSTEEAPVTPATAQHTADEQNKYRLKARHYATRPVDECNAYYATRSDQVQYLAQARNDIVSAAITAAKTGDKRNVPAYVPQSVIAAAEHAKAEIESGVTFDENLSHPLLARIMHVAKNVFAPASATVPGQGTLAATLSSASVTSEPSAAMPATAPSVNGLSASVYASARSSFNGSVSSDNDNRNEQKHLKMALYYAKCPVDECDAYHNKFPDRRQYLEPARKRLAKEAIAIAKSGDIREAPAILVDHWALEAAAKAKYRVEEGGPQEADASWASHPLFAHIVAEAKSVFTPKTPTVPSLMGQLKATIFDMAGHVLGNHSVKAPCEAKLSITIPSGPFDPRGLIEAMETLATVMQRSSAGLSGVTMHDDGLYEEDDEEL